MKRTVLLFTVLVAAATAFSQPDNNPSKNNGQINLAAGQKMVIETTSNVEADLGMGMMLNSNSVSTNTLDVKQVSETNYTITSTLTRLKMNMDMMGQSNNYDSDDKNNNSGEMASVFSSKINKPTDIVIDKVNGKPITLQSKSANKKKEEPKPGADLTSIFADNSDEALVSGSFEVIPAGKLVGDRWSDSTVSKESKIYRTYLLKSIADQEAVIGLEIITKAKNTLDFQGMEFEINTETKTTGEIVTNPATSLVKKKTSTSDISGSFQMMGQEMPIQAKVVATSIYK